VSQKDQYQGVLLGNNHALFTAAPMLGKLSVPNMLLHMPLKMPPAGAILEYGEGRVPEGWTSSAHAATACNIQAWLFRAPKRPFIGRQHMAIDPHNVHIEYFTKKYNTIFLDVKVGDHVTLISPPVFMWTDKDQHTGTWCVAATTFHFVLSEYIQLFTTLEM
jgi:hypothetical protein